MGFSLSVDLSARDSNIGPKSCPRSDIGRGLIDRVMTKTKCYVTESSMSIFFESGGNLRPRLKSVRPNRESSKYKRGNALG